jgi:oxygen-dependent protoporphyrinogen oxidase
MKRRIVIVGAGISGLALGWFLKQSQGDDIDLTILEKDARPGGWIRSIEKNGFLFDTGPRSCRTREAGKNTLKLIEALGLQNEVVACSPQAKHRYLFSNGKLQKLPSSLLGAIFSPVTRKYMPLLLKEWFTAPNKNNEETIAEFISRRFSPAFAENFFDPLTLGIYAGDTHNLSMSACFSEMVQWEQQHGSILKGLFRHKSEQDANQSEFVKEMSKVPIFTFKNGMESLTRALSHQLSKHIRVGMPATEITTNPSHLIIRTPSEEIIADHVFLAIPPHAIAKAFEPLSHELKEFHAATVAAVHLGWNTKTLQKEGFGYLIPTKEKEQLLGVIFDSSAFPQQNRSSDQTRMTAMLGGTTGPDVAKLCDDTLIGMTRRAIASHLGIDMPPDFAAVSRAPHAIPQYTKGHTNRVKSLKKSLNDLANGRITLLGSSWHGVSVNDCIREAENLTCMGEGIGVTYQKIASLNLE